jgi:hypothetical protein
MRSPVLHLPTDIPIFAFSIALGEELPQYNFRFPVRLSTAHALF